MEKRNEKETGRFAAGPNEWQAQHEGDWQLAESNEEDEEDTAILLTAQAGQNEKQPLYATGGNPDDEDKNEDADEDEDNPQDWGHTDPLDSPFPDSTDPTAPGSAV